MRQEITNPGPRQAKVQSDCTTVSAINRSRCLRLPIFIMSWPNGAGRLVLGASARFIRWLADCGSMTRSIGIVAAEDACALL